VQVAKNGCAKAAYEDVATFQEKVVIGLKRPNPDSGPVRIDSGTFLGSIQVIQLKVDNAVKKISRKPVVEEHAASANVEESISRNCPTIDILLWFWASKGSVHGDCGENCGARVPSLGRY
jgi:hypothetical protein